MDLAIPRPKSYGRQAGVIFSVTVGAFCSITVILPSFMGIFMKTISDEFGWTRTSTAGALAAVSLATALASPIVGRIIDRFGARAVAIVGLVALALCLLAISYVPNNVFIYQAMFFVAGIFGACPSTLAFGRVLASWFDRSRGLWLGFCGGVGYGGSGMVFPLIGAYALQHYGWRGGFVIASIMLLVIALPIMLVFLRNSPNEDAEDVSAAHTEKTGVAFRDAIRTPLFWWLFTLVPLGSGCMTAMFSTIVPLLSDNGFSIDSAVLVVQTFALTTVFMQPLAGWMADRASTPRILAPMFLLAAVGLVILLTAKLLALQFIGGALMGAGAATEFTMLLFFVSRYYGLKDFGAISGVFLFGTLFFGAAAPVMLNLFFDLAGSYHWGVIIIIAILIYNGLSLLFLPRYRFVAKE